jgi:hypothetical protein
LLLLSTWVLKNRNLINYLDLVSRNTLGVEERVKVG